MIDHDSKLVEPRAFVSSDFKPLRSTTRPERRVRGASREVLILAPPVCVGTRSDTLVATSSLRSVQVPVMDGDARCPRPGCMPVDGPGAGGILRPASDTERAVIGCVCLVSARRSHCVCLAPQLFYAPSSSRLTSTCRLSCRTTKLPSQCLLQPSPVPDITVQRPGWNLSGLPPDHSRRVRVGAATRPRVCCHVFPAEIAR